MRVEYDKSANAAYIYLINNIADGGIKHCYPCDPIEVGGMINLDFDGEGREGRLIGIEVLGASEKLPKEILDLATIIG